MITKWHLILLATLSISVFSCAKKDDDGGGGDSEPSGDGGGDAPGDTDAPGDDADDSKSDGTDDGADPAGTLAISGDLGTSGTVYALPLAEGAPTATATLDAPSTEADGPFTLQIDDGANLTDGPKGHVLIVTDDSKPRLDQADDVKFLVMPVGEEELIGLPTGEAKGEEIKLGKLKSTDDGLAADVKSGDSPFTTEQKVIEQMARVDDAVRVAKNAYVNANPKTKVFADGTVVFHWKGSVLQSRIAESPPVPDHDPSDMLGGAPLFMGYGVNVETNHPDFAFKKLCQGGDYPNISFLPPTAGVENGDHCDDPSAAAIDERWPCFFSQHADPSVAGTALQHAFTKSQSDDTFYGPDEVFTSDNSCLYQWPVPDSGDLEYSISVQHAQGDDKLHIVNFGGPNIFKGDVTPGLWQITSGGKAIAKFDLAVASPYRKVTVDATDYNYPNVYIPSYSITRNGDNVITAVGLSLFLYKFDPEKVGDATFVRVKDFATVKRVVQDLQVGFSSNDGGTDVGSRTQAWATVDWENADINDGVITLQPEDLDKFVYPNEGETVEDGKKLVWTIGINYDMFGTSYQFMWGCNADSDVECAD